MPDLLHGVVQRGVERDRWARRERDTALPAAEADALVAVVRYPNT